MTIEVEFFNKSQDRKVKVLYRDIGYAQNDEPAAVTESEAGVIEPQGRASFWMHDHRQLLVMEQE
jgi:hypothetical protein